MRLVTRAVLNLNGISVLYLMAAVNAGLQLMISFGLTLNPGQETGITIFLNAALAFIGHFNHRLGELESVKNIGSGVQNPTTELIDSHQTNVH